MLAEAMNEALTGGLACAAVIASGLMGYFIAKWQDSEGMQMMIVRIRDEKQRADRYQREWDADGIRLKQSRKESAALREAIDQLHQMAQGDKR